MINVPYRDNMPWLYDNTVFYVLHGSKAYGTSLPTSDTDYRGVAVAPLSWMHGFTQRFEQVIEHGEVDVQITALDKFLRLATDNNPNVMEQLFVDDKHVLREDPAFSWLIRGNRELFISQKAYYTYRGYAMSQLHRIKSHREWLMNPPSEPSELPVDDNNVKAALSMIEKKMDSWALDLTSLELSDRVAVLGEMKRVLSENEAGQFEAAGNLLGFDSNFLQFLQQQQGIRAKWKNWRQYQNWLKSRNPERAATEAKFGYDTKHAMHLIRLMRMAVEILELGEVNVYRKYDAKELLDIRAGVLTFDEVLAAADYLDARAKELIKKTTLRKKPNVGKIDELCVEFVSEFYGLNELPEV